MNFSVNQEDLHSATKGRSSNYSIVVFIALFLQLRVVISCINDFNPSDFIKLFLFKTCCLRPNHHTYFVSGVLWLQDFGHLADVLGCVLRWILILGVFHINHLAFFVGVNFIYGLVLINFIEGQSDFGIILLNPSLRFRGVFVYFFTMLLWCNNAAFNFICLKLRLMFRLF